MNTTTQTQEQERGSFPAPEGEGGIIKWVVMGNGTLHVTIEAGGLTAFEVINLDNGETVGGNVTMIPEIRERAIAEAKGGEKSTHTPGPWKVGAGPHNRNREVFDARGFLVADCMTSNKDESTERANTRLIAASPELLEACRDALDIVNSYSHIPALGKACAILIAAIAKAEGGAK